MKKYLLFALCAILGMRSFTSAAYQNQGFSSFTENENSVDFTCKEQCFIGIDKLGNHDLVQIDGTLRGEGAIGYGFHFNGQVFPGGILEVHGERSGHQEFLFNDAVGYDQMPKEAQIIVFMQGNIQGDDVSVGAVAMNFLDSIKSGLKSAAAYVPYNPRTVNFLEFPKRNGKYINQVFFRRIIGLFLIAIFTYKATVKKGKKHHAIALGVGVLVFFRVLFDVFATMNQVRMYREVMDAEKIMDNGRLGKSGDFYNFLEYVKETVPAGSKGYFLATYPYNFEGKFHAYPHVRLGTLTGSDAIIYYNPYGEKNPFGFVDPVYDGNKSVLEGSGWSIDVEKEIIWQPYAKIYLVK